MKLCKDCEHFKPNSFAIETLKYYHCSKYSRGIITNNPKDVKNLRCGKWGETEMKVRLCLKDNSSVLVSEDFGDIKNYLNNNQFIKVTNHKTGKEELYNRDFIWCVRQSSQE